VLREHPAAVGPYLATRDHFVQRLYHQHSGYWQPDGQGLEPIDPADRAAALDLLADGRPEPFAAAAHVLLDQRDPALALEITTAGLARHPDARELAELRQQALYRLMERHQLQDPFRFLAEAALAAGDLDGAACHGYVARLITARPFLPGTAGEWAHAWRRRLEDHRIRAVECLAQVQLRRGQATAAIRSAELVLELDSLRETAWQILIRSHAAAGNPGSALRAYQRCRQVLQQQLGTAPSPGTRAALAGLSR
jgi:Bacterial transcriptional activator domain